ncbi:MAG TPA: toxic anion resistance protein [Lachnospiraceae bacterium]|nr:toxic anion resistance protein [Lachnospiraceae bacterium]
MSDVTLESLLEKKDAKQDNTTAQVRQQTALAVETQVENLTPEQEAKVAQIRKEIDLTDSNVLVQYGIGAQRDIQNFSDTILQKVQVKDSGRTGQLLADLSDQVRSMHVDDLLNADKIPIIGSLLHSLHKFAQRYETVEVQVDRISNELEKDRMSMIRDITMFNTMYDMNIDHFRNLQVYIKAGEEEITDIRTNTLPRLREEAEAKGDPMSAQVVKDYEENVNRFEKKIHDMKISKTIAMQTAPQIRLIQNNDRLLVDKIQTAILQTIPLWKNQIVLAIGLERQEKVLKNQQQITETTNKLLEANSQMLHQNTVETMKESERGLADIETLKKVNDELIATINDSIRIQQEGHQARVSAEKELVQIESQLKGALLQNTANKEVSAQ